MKKIFIQSMLSAMCLTLASCVMDHPYGPNEPTGHKDGVAYLDLAFNVADTETTRAENITASSAEEKVIKTVDLYIFNSSGELEQFVDNAEVENNKLKNRVEVKNTGEKTIYAITNSPTLATTVKSDSQAGTMLADFKKLAFSASKDVIANLSDGFVMTGLEEKMNISKTYETDEKYSPNSTTIKVTRAAAKTQLRVPASAYSQAVEGIKISNPKFYVLQNHEVMNVENQGAMTTTAPVSGGTCSDYSVASTSSAYLTPAKAEFGEAGSEYYYLGENYVAEPKSGNISFISVKFDIASGDIYSFNSTDGLTNTNVSGKTNMHVVGKANADNGTISYVCNPEAGKQSEILCFDSDSDSAQQYASYLNDKYGITDANEGYKAILFNNGVYYRINIANPAGATDSEKYQILRNRLYRVSLNKVNFFGRVDESSLLPAAWDTPLVIEGDRLLQISFEISDWENVDQDVDLE